MKEINTQLQQLIATSRQPPNHSKLLQQPSKPPEKYGHSSTAPHPTQDTTAVPTPPKQKIGSIYNFTIRQ
jgi:hypothetical protein